MNTQDIATSISSLTGEKNRYHYALTVCKVILDFVVSDNFGRLNYTPYYSQKYEHIMKPQGKKQAITAIDKNNSYSDLPDDKNWRSVIPTGLYKMHIPIPFSENKCKTKHLTLLISEGILPESLETS